MLGERQILLRDAVVGILDLAEVQERRAAERQHEGVKIDRGKGGGRRLGRHAGGVGRRRLRGRR